MSSTSATRVFDQLKRIFGPRYDDCSPVIADWIATVDGMTDEQIRHALAACPELSWVPTPAQFATLGSAGTEGL